MPAWPGAQYSLVHTGEAAMAQQAHDLKTRVVAAGVTTAPQMASIWQFGVTLVQGSMVAEASEHLDFDFRQYAG